MAQEKKAESSPLSESEKGKTSGHQRRWQKTYGFLGFNKGYNFPLFIIFAGTMFGFCLARAEYLNINVYSKNAAPREWYWYQAGYYRVGIIMHLATVLPAGWLMVFQFVPIIRHKYILFHRINGYIVSILILLGVASALMLTRRSFGGTPSTQCGLGLLAIMVTGSLGMAYYNIKRLQVDQHRAWMLRTMFYCGVIISLRICMIISAQILPLLGDYYVTFSCAELNTLNSPAQLRRKYPQCFDLSDGSGNDNAIPIRADFTIDSESVGSALDIGFAMGLWLAIFLHVVGVEIYLNLTRAESERLREVAYKKQLDAGMRHPGSAGLTTDRWGDVAAWKSTQHVV